MKKMKIKTIKKINKIAIILIVLVTCVNIFYNYSYADTIVDTNAYKPTDDPATPTKTVAIVSTILGVIQAIGIVLSVIMLAALGIKYMIGSVEDKANYKENMVPYIIGAVLIGAGPTIVNLIYKYAKEINTSI